MKGIFKHPLGITLTIIVVAAVTIAGLSIATKPPSLHDGNTVEVRVDKGDLKATVAVSDESRARGLAGVPGPLGDTQGMLFIFPQSGLHQFWMKGVGYPIDIIWIENDTVSEVIPNIPTPAAGTPDEDLPKYQPNFPVTRALEVEAGWAARHNIQPGDPVRISR